MPHQICTPCNTGTGTCKITEKTTCEQQSVTRVNASTGDLVRGTIQAYTPSLHKLQDSTEDMSMWLQILLQYNCTGLLGSTVGLSDAGFRAKAQLENLGAATTRTNSDTEQVTFCFVVLLSWTSHTSGFLSSCAPSNVLAQVVSS